MAKFDDDDVDNVTLNLQRPQYNFHAKIPPTPGTPAVAVVDTIYGVAAVATVVEVVAVPAKACIDTRTQKKTHTLSLEIGRALTMENMAYVILKNYNDHFKSAKVSKKDQDIKLRKVCKDTV